MSVLTDDDISVAMQANKLIQNGIPKRIGPACYELRMGSVYYDLTESDKPIQITVPGTVLIKPGHRVVLITEEALDIPHDIVARVTSKGSLFSIGLSPISTYADPGFAGNLGIVTQNISDRYIEIPAGEPIAKIDFSQLTNPVKNAYKGQHGYQTQIWPIRHNLQKNYEDVKNDPRMDKEDVEAYKLLPRSIVQKIQHIQKHQRLIDVVIAVAFAANAFAILGTITKLQEASFAITTNLIASGIIGVLSLFRRIKD